MTQYQRFRRSVVQCLVIAQVLQSVPLLAATAPAPQEPSATRPAPPPAAPVVRVNRTVPVVTPRSALPVFSTDATDRELMAAHVFEEPLLPTGATDPIENRELAAVLMGYLSARTPELTGEIDAHLRRFPRSPWRASLRTNVGLVLRRTGYFSRALVFFEDAWAELRDARDRRTRELADRALGELFELNARLGRADVLQMLFDQIEGRDLTGSATEKVAGARQALWTMRNRPEEAFLCGPLGLHQILLAAKAGYVADQRVLAFPSTPRGTSLAQMAALARTVGFPMLPVRRTSLRAPLVLPALVHWRSDHFASLIREEGGRVLVRDTTFGGEFWMTRAAVDQESSGYFLVPEATLPAGWARVAEDEMNGVWGRGLNTTNDPTCTECSCRTAGGEGGDPPASPCASGSCGMTTYRFHLMVVSLNLQDTPVWYAPPRGPNPRFTVTYSQREAFQPQTFSYSNLGPKWTFDWLSYVEDDPTNPSAPVGLYVRGGGYQQHTGYNAGTYSYTPFKRDHAIMVRTGTSPVQYERRLNDGSVEVFGQPNGAATYPRKVFLTAWKDPQGNTVTFTYDANLRVVAATDAIGQVTTVSYEHADPLKVTKVTDPFGRFATFAYDATGRLTQITDMGGLSSNFAYGGDDFVNALTTPYGTTRFVKGERGLDRWLEAVDPLGGRERLEYGIGLTYSDPPATVPTGMNTWNTYLNKSTSHYWNKRAMALAPGEKTKAHTFHWAAIPGGVVASGTLESEKRALENRIWYNYPGQSLPDWEGTGIEPTAVGRVLDDGTSQVSKAEYNARGKVTKRIDPLGRETQYVYAANNIDLTEVRQKVGGSTELLYSATYNSQHLPLTVTDAASQTTTFTYNSAGQVLTVANPKSETTTYVYSPIGHLQSIAGPVTGATSSFSYDAYGRVRTVTDSDGYEVTTDYDAFDRWTHVTYPDGTYDEAVYTRLDATARRDRLGRWSRTTYDGLRRVVSTRDAEGRVLTQRWCPCGSLDALIDANGNATTWSRDTQGRVTRETRANGAFTAHVYEGTTSRLKTVTDPKGQVTTYSYALDDALLGTTFTNSQVATPSVSFTYEPIYPRLASMLDGTGTTAYTHYPTGTLGAGRVATVDGPLANDTIAYTYDELGRVVQRSINGAANTLTLAYDGLSRVLSETNVLGTFAYAYDGGTGRLASVIYPNGQTSTHSYLPTLQDRRLQTIHHRYPSGATLSKFDYTYDAVGNVLTWQQQADNAPPIVWAHDYDRVDQLLVATKHTTAPAPQVLKRYVYAYDPAGNRLTEQIDDVATGWTYDAMNRLITQEAGGTLRFAGGVNETAEVSVGGVPAMVTSTNAFGAQAAVTPGTNVVTIVATDGSGNATTNRYQVEVAGTALNYTFDANGSVTSDGIRTFEWDARNQLSAVVDGTIRRDYSYDGNQRRVREVVRDGQVIQSDTRFIWCGNGVCEERSADGVQVLKRVEALGEWSSGGVRFVTTDHLGSIRDVVESGGLVARYAFEPWGRRTLLAGTDVITRGFTSHRTEGQLASAWYRTYDAVTGRWLSEDPLGMVDGPNRFSYVGNNPVRRVDPDGRQAEAGVLTVIVVCSPDPVTKGVLIGAAVLAGVVIVYKACENGCFVSSKPRNRRTERCEIVFKSCTESCSDILPTGGDPFKFFNCVNACMARNGC